MKKHFLSSIVLAVFVPILFLRFCDVPNKNTTPDSNLTEQPVINQSTTITVLINNEPQELALEEYVLGVVLAEMPASFGEEALKAQAVVARTFALKRSTVTPKHSNADICADSTCCQAYCSAQDYLAQGGIDTDVEKVKQAVKDTSGQVLTFENDLIDATYFSCSGGRTENAVAVWGTDIPYLQATDSPGEEQATHYTDTVVIRIDEFCKMLGVDPYPKTSNWIGKITYTEGGGVDTIILNGVQYRGVFLRHALKLRSTAFVISAIGDNVMITTKGFGHRVGMSQYGADAMAEKGSDYSQILSHYYKGTELSIYNPD